MNKSIQLLRGISIVYIIVLHSTFMWPVKLQNIYFNFFDTASGVELFFCIAGYFSAKKIYSYQTYTFQSFIGYVLNRFKRLSPLLFFWATVMFVSFHSKCKVLGQRSDTVQQFREPGQRSVPRVF